MRRRSGGRNVGEARALVVSHLGDGNVHYILMFPHEYWQALPDGEAKALEVEMAVHDIAVRFGGTISPEHGIGRKPKGESVLSSGTRSAAEFVLAVWACCN